MNHIMISIRPEWVAKILNGEKTLEIRKSIPKELLKGEECIVEIYCTKDQKHLVAPFRFIEGWFYKEYNDNTNYACGCTSNIGETINGKVVARWHLKKYDKIEICDPYIFRNNKQEDWKYFEKNACLTCEQMMEYIGYGEDHDGWDKKYDIGYAWHIHDLEIYDKPKELSEFKTLPCYKPEKACANCRYLQVTNTPYAYETYCPIENGVRLTRPPQSWCYIDGE